VRSRAHPGPMQNTRPADVVREAERYLDAVELFRAEGCHPRWRLEPGAERRRSGASRAAGLGPLETISRRSK
jgi:hypothetical protein